jgi:DNA-binding transcriptional MerR regulator
VGGRDLVEPSNPVRSSSRPVYSIGAVARMFGVETATLRAWEDRYGVVVPARSTGGQRLYTRDQVEQLRSILRRMEDGSSTADAHRLLAEEIESPTDHDRPGRDVLMLVLLAERDRYAAELCEFFLRTEGFDVCLASTPANAETLFAARRPSLSVVELTMSGGLELCRSFASGEMTPVLAVSPLAMQDEALAAGASAFLQKPLEELQFVSTVRDLLRSSALTRPDRVHSR